MTKLYILDGFNVSQCRHCGLVFRDVILEKEETKQLYSEDYFTKEQKDYFFDKADQKLAIFKDRLKRIEKINPDKGKLLDVGCAIGTFLTVARKSKWEVKGVEFSEFASDYARKNFRLDVLTGALEYQKLDSRSFDIITLWDVIDHNEAPQNFLGLLYSLLKPNGLLVVQTNMEDSLLYRIAHYIYKLSFGLIKKPVARCHPIHHSTFYSGKTLRIALERTGFKIVKTEADDLEPELINTNKLLRLILRIISFFASIVGKPHEITFYARKVS